MSDIRGSTFGDKSKNKETDGAIMHGLALIGGAIGGGIGYFMSNDEFVKENARNATNWQISVFLYSIVLSFMGGFGSSMIFILFILNIAFSAMATKKSMNGEIWSYPLSIKFISGNYETEQETDENKIERIKSLYIKGVIDEDEMEERIDLALRFEDANERRERLRQIEMSRN